MARRYSGYITVDRSIFDHPVLRRPERLVAWQWLIATAAWKPEGRRGSWGVVHLERGELATSVRILAKTWRWPPGRVQRFLNRLRGAHMITVTKTRSATRSKTDSPTDSPTGPHLEHDISIVSICNYDKFQNSSTGQKGKSIQQPIHQPIRRPAETQMLPGFSEPLTTEPSNQVDLEKGSMGDGEGKRVAPTAPRHGTRSTKHGTIYIYRGTEDWRVYAEDYNATTGAEPLPDRFGGFWFFANGEAARPAHQRTWRNRNAFGAAKNQRGGAA